MAATTVRMSEETREKLRDLAHQEHESMQTILDKAVEAYRLQLFWDQVTDAYAALRADPEAWAEELAERKLWEATLMDGLEDEYPLEDDLASRLLLAETC